MKDSFGRTIDYLRLSVTDLCNYRCIYCMPEAGVCKRAHAEILSIEELYEIAAAAVRCGVKQLRLTGGEPLVRRGILELCRMLRSLPGLETLTMTTNAGLLAPVARELKDAGVDRLNISLDTLNAARFAAITRRGRLDDALAGLRAAKEAGFTNTKINAVLLGGVNEEDIAPLARYNMETVQEIGACITELCAQPQSFEELLKALFDLYGMTMTFEQYALVGGTVRSYLTWLKETGRVAAEFADNRMLWRRV